MYVKRPMLIGAIIITVVPPIIINSPVSYVPLVFLALVSLVSIAYTLILSGFCKVVVESRGIEQYERETTVSYKVKVDNRNFLVVPHIVLSLCVESTQGLPMFCSESPAPLLLPCSRMYF